MRTRIGVPASLLAIAAMTFGSRVAIGQDAAESAPPGGAAWASPVFALILAGLTVFVVSKLLSRGRRSAAERQPSRVPRKGVRDRAEQAAHGKSEDNNG